LEAVVEELPDSVTFESTNPTDNSTISSKQTGTQAKRKSPADVLESHLKQKSENQADRKVLTTQQAVRVQLKSYCMGMKQLMSLKKYKDAYGEDEEQLQLIERMESTIGVAVGNMETAIKSGTLWCPPQEENIAERTPKRGNKASKPAYKSSSSSGSILSAKRRILTSSSKKDYNLYVSSDSDSDSIMQESISNVKKAFCCAGDYCWKEDDPKNFTATCSVCKGKCHEHCSERNKDNIGVTCGQCRKK
jgi:hypothetical protein